MPETLVHRGLPLRADFDAGGIVLRPLFLRPLAITWKELEFICVTPTMERHSDGWREKTYPVNFLPKGFRSTFATSGHLWVELVVRDRRPILARTQGRWTRAWLANRLNPMLDASDQRQPDQSLLGLDLYKHRLNAPLDDLLDLMARHCRFDLVVHF